MPGVSLAPSAVAPLQVHGLTPVAALLPRLAGQAAPAAVEVVDDSGCRQGLVDAAAVTSGVARMIGERADDTSWIEVVMPQTDYSASAVARAVEDADAALLGLMASPDPSDPLMLHVSICAGHADPSAVVRSLERYGFSVAYAQPADTADSDTARRRLSELKMYLSI